MSTKRNAAIEIYRYLFAFLICTLHFKEYYGNPYPWGGAYLGVEFFLILAGFFEMHHIYSRHKENGAPEEMIGTYLWERIKRLYPQYAISLIMYYIYRIFITPIITVKDALVHYLPEWGMIQILGFGRWLNSAMWYISAMLFASLVIYFFAVKNKKKFGYVIAPSLCLILYSWMYQTNGSLAGIGLNSRTFIVADGFWRALAGMLLGCVVYVFYYQYKEKIASKFKSIRTVMEIGIIVLIVYCFYGPGNTVKDFTLTALMALLVLSVMSGGSHLTEMLNKLPIKGTYTYALYCNHWLVNYVIKEHFPGYSFYPTLAVFIVISFILSVITTHCISFITKLIKHKLTPANI